jgi:predicted GNAT family N-acyltransferase
MILIKVVTNEDDYKKALEIRRKVFVEEQGVPLSEEQDEYDSTATHYLAYLDGKVCGTCRVRNTPKGQKIERNCVLPEFRNKGIGKKLISHVIEQLDPKYPIYLHAQVGVQFFYEALNFVAQGEIFYEANIPHVLMFLQRK